MAADRHPFTRVCDLNPCRHVATLFMKSSEKLKAFIAFLMYSCDIESKALEKSMSRGVVMFHRVEDIVHSSCNFSNKSSGKVCFLPSCYDSLQDWFHSGC